MKTNTHKGTWLGRAGTSTVYRHVSSQYGLRVVAQVWDDTPDVAELRLIRGDGRKREGFEKLRAEIVSVESVEATASEWLEANRG